MSKKKEILLGVTGSIAVYKACDIIRRLQDKGCSVRVVMTEGAQAFITPLTLASLSGREVFHRMFEERSQAWEKSHISLARDTDLFLIAPATANVIGKIANGLADDLLTCTAMATKAPMLIAPAMNEAMYQNKIVQENIRKLKKNGIQFIDPIKGRLACGAAGEGHLAEVEDIVKAVLRSLKR